MDLYPFAQQIAPLLGEGWTVNPPDPDREWTRSHPTLTHAETGANFTITGPCTYGADRGKLSVHCNWPKDGTGSEARPHFSQYSDMGAAAPSISFASTKTPAVAAKDIARRFLPAFLPLYVKQAATVQGDEDAIAARRRLAEAVAKLVQGSIRDDSHRNHGRLAEVYMGHREKGIAAVSFRSDPEQLEVTIRCTLAELERIVELFTPSPGVGQTCCAECGSDTAIYCTAAEGHVGEHRDDEGRTW